MTLELDNGNVCLCSCYQRQTAERQGKFWSFGEREKINSKQLSIEVAAID